MAVKSRQKLHGHNLQMLARCHVAFHNDDVEFCGFMMLNFAGL